MSAPHHWIAKYVGAPWQLGGRGPRAFDCWGLLWWVYRTEWGIELPEYAHVLTYDAGIVARVIDQAVRQGAQSGEWRPLATPVDGCAVALSTREVYHHVGIYGDVDGGLVLHAADYKNAAAQSLLALRGRGYRKINFFQHHGSHR